MLENFPLFRGEKDEKFINSEATNLDKGISLRR